MCGIVGVVSATPVNQLIYDSLLLLQHRGQDAAGIATASGSTFHMHKANGMVRDVFRTRNMRGLPGTINSRTNPRIVRATGPPGSVSGIQPAATPENVYATQAANNHPSSASTSRINPRNSPISADVTMMNSTP